MTAVRTSAVTGKGSGSGRSARTRARARTAVVAASVAAMGVVGTVGSVAHAGAGPPGSLTANALTQNRVQAPAQTPEPPPEPPKPGDVPPRESLELALLDEADMGTMFLRSPQAPPPRGERESGCPALDAATAPGDEQDPPEVEFTATDVLVSQALYGAEPNEVQRAHAQFREALASCDAIGVRGTDGETVTMTVTPMDIGRPDAVAVSMTGMHLDSVVTGFLVFEALGSVELVYTYTQVGSADGQLAESVYLTALDKMQRVLGAAASPATPM
ncbi:hypothetical protein [Yinghuangia sp. YIM S10712]|uniref:hypothetical protein n=1 Tax=Yinghuangia sp. YIM S10712 TaxID=3436930 RepID=UPI003F53744D